MAKLSAHGRELLRARRSSVTLAYLEDGAILAKGSDGRWKRRGKVSLGPSPDGIAERLRAFGWTVEQSVHSDQPIRA